MQAKYLVVIAVAGMVAFGAARAGAPAAAKPASKPAAKPPEVMKGPVDPFSPTRERNRFFTATGPDNELSQGEFAASKGQPRAFARVFDRFKTMQVFDKNGNKTIDWFEAMAYRKDLRARVVAAYDANKDGKLIGAERDKANRDLAAGKVPPRRRDRPVGQWWQVDPQDVKKHDADGDGKLSAGERRAMWRTRTESRQKEILQKYDANKSGELDEDEIAAVRKEMTERWMLRRHDRDRDGKLNEQEAAAMEEARARWEKRAQQWEQRRKELVAKHDGDGDGELNAEETKAMWEDLRGQWLTRRFDKDGDGKLNEAETAAMTEAEAERKAMYEGWQKGFVKKYDKDGNGALSEAERRAAMEDIGETVRKIAADWTAKWDADGDGELSEAERQTMRGALEKRREELTRQIDADGDGKVTREERRAFFEKLRKTYDVDGDGALSPDELKAMIQDQIRRIQAPKE